MAVDGEKTSDSFVGPPELKVVPLGKDGLVKGEATDRFMQTSFGKFLTRVEKKHNGDKEDEPVESEAEVFERQLNDAAARLASSSSGVKVKVEDGKCGVSISVDLSKAGGISSVVPTPDVSSFGLKLLDAAGKVKSRYYVYTSFDGGKMSYYYWDHRGNKRVLSASRLKGRAEIDIFGNQLKAVSREDLYAFMSEKMRAGSKEAAKQVAFSERASLMYSVTTDSLVTDPDTEPSYVDAPTAAPDEPHDEPPVARAPVARATVVDAPRRAEHVRSPVPDEPLSSYRPGGSVNVSTPHIPPPTHSTPAYSESAAPRYAPRVEVDPGQFEVKVDKVPRGAESPTGMPMQIYSCANKKLDGPVKYITVFGPDGRWGIDGMVSSYDYLDQLKQLWASGVNAVLVVPSYDLRMPGNKRDRWKFLGGKMPAIHDYCAEKYGAGDNNIVTLSGGYRAFAYAMKGVSNQNFVASFTLLDSLFDDTYCHLDDAIVAYLTATKGAGRVSAYNGTARVKNNANTVWKRVSGKLKDNPDLLKAFRMPSALGKSHFAAMKENFLPSMMSALKPSGFVDSPLAGGKVSYPGLIPQALNVAGWKPVYGPKRRRLKYSMDPRALSLLKTPSRERVVYTCPFSGKQFYLPKIVAEQMELAQTVAKEMGLAGVSLGYGYRDAEHQARIARRNSRATGASREGSRHRNGSAVDVRGIYADGKTTVGSALEKVMARAGFVRYAHPKDPFHYEGFGSEHFAAIMNQLGLLPPGSSVADFTFPNWHFPNDLRGKQIARGRDARLPGSDGGS